MTAYLGPHTKAWYGFRAEDDFRGSELGTICNLNRYKTAKALFERGADASDVAMQWGQRYEPLARAYWLKHYPTRVLLSSDPIHWQCEGLRFALSVDGLLPFENAVWEQKTLFTCYERSEISARARLYSIQETNLPELQHRVQLEAYCRGHKLPRASIVYCYPPSEKLHPLTPMEDEEDVPSFLTEIVYTPNDGFWKEFCLPRLHAYKNGAPSRTPYTKAVLDANSYWSLSSAPAASLP